VRNSAEVKLGRSCHLVIIFEAHHDMS